MALTASARVRRMALWSSEQRWTFSLLAFSALLWLTFSSSTAPANQHQAYGGDGSQFRSFPLWKDVPVRRFAVLKEGENRRGTRWGVFAFRRPGSRGKGRDMPCLLLSRITASGLYGISSGCGPLAPSSGLHSLPVSVGNGLAYSKTPGGPFSEESFHAMTFAPEVSGVRVEVAPGPSVGLMTKYLSVKKSKKSHLAQFRYVTFSLLRDICLDSVTGFNDDGDVVLDADFNEC
jgi:hypothetical protein